MTRRFCLLIFTVMIASALGTAAELRGRVVNGTTKKPAAGDDVVLLTISQEGMTESSRATADRSGHFSLPVADSQASHVVRVVHQGVTYHRSVDASDMPLAIAVYDVADKLDDVSAVMDVQRFEATDQTLEIKQLVTMRNNSNPPRTLLNRRAFEVELPAEAKIVSGLVQVEDAAPLKQMPVPGDQKGQFYFAFPIRPGDTRFAVVYRLPYSGGALIEPKIRNSLEKFVVMLPRSMKFQPKDAGSFESMPGTTPDNVQGTGPLRPDQVVAFRIFGTGTLEELEGRRREAPNGKPVSATRPGGGLGPPIEAPDPLQKYRLTILAATTVLMGAGAVYVMRKTRLPHAETRQWVGSQVATGVTKKQASRKDINHRHRQRARCVKKSSLI